MRRLLQWLSRLLFPPKCVLCRRILPEEQTDLCHACRADTRDGPATGDTIKYIARWTALWHYDDPVRDTILRLKFYGCRHLAKPLGRLLAMRVTKAGADFDLLTWAPISAKRKLDRGYDQGELIARSLGKELGIRPAQLLQKHHHTPPQSTLTGEAQRRANVLGAYRLCVPREAVAGKRVLLLDDVITTGSTVSECARVLLTAGAKEVTCAVIASAHHQHKDQ